MIYKLSELQRTAGKYGFAIPHVLGGNLEMTYGAIKAAEKLHSPIALGLAPEVFADIPMDMAFAMILSLAKRSHIPVAVQLEHGKSYEQIAKAISLGVQSVMFDGSDLPYEENVQKTKEIVRMAHAFGVCVEAELGYVAGSAVREKAASCIGQKTDVHKVRDFVERTGIDTLAVSFGNIHGHYKGELNIDTDLVKEIARMTDVPLVMHGGSGLPETMYRSIIDAGISNIHFYSGVVMYAWEELKKRVGEDDLYPPYHELVSYNLDFFERKTSRLIELMGSADKADLYVWKRGSH